jgi:toxin-antitoxin system PIN domain toxin
MTHLLDVNVLLAAIWENHPHHARTFRWLAGKQISVCPLSEMGFIRISTNPKAIHAPMEKARDLLQNFLAERAVRRIPDNLPALDSHPQKTEQVTDFYLAALADKHGMKLATLDEKINHPAAVLVEQLEKRPGRATA